MFILLEENEQVEPINTLPLKQEDVKKGGNNMAAVTNEKKNLNSQTEDVSEFIMLLKQMSDSDRMIIKGMMMWAAGENRPVKTA